MIRLSNFINKQNLVIMVIHTSILIVMYLILNKLGAVNFLPNEKNIVSWDSVWYKQIGDVGYIYLPFQASNMAFFPLFPLLWKLSLSSGLIISIINVVIFIFSFSLLLGKEKLKIPYLLVLISFPSFIFFHLPYSEALFFFFGTLVLLGYRSDHRLLLSIGILGCCLTRAVSTTFIPIILLTELLCFVLLKKRPAIRIIKQTCINCAICLGSILIIVLIQGIQTGKWFYYLEAVKYYNRCFLIPKLPLTTYSPKMILGVDAVAWTTGMIAIFFAIRLAITYVSALFFGVKQQFSMSKGVCFSVLFLASVLVLDTFFTNYVGESTNIWSINRHLLCTPFAVYFFNWYYQELKNNDTDLFWIGLIIICGIYLTGIYKYQHHVFFYVLFFTSLVVSKVYSKGHWLLLIPYIFNIYLFIILYDQFLAVRWVG